MSTTSYDAPSSAEQTIIGASVKVEGEFESQGDIIVEGVLNGSLKTKQYLQIGSNAKITANIFAQSAQIAGNVKGNIHVNDTLKLLSTAHILGDVQTSKLIIEEGAIFNGKCSMGQGTNSQMSFSSTASNETPETDASDASADEA